MIKVTSYDINELKNLIENHNYTVLRNVSSKREIGIAIVEEGFLGINIPESLSGYIDYEAIARDREFTLINDLKMAIEIF